WARVNGERAACCTLPSYAWQRQRYWLDTASDRPVSPAARYISVGGERGSYVWGLTVDEGHTVVGRPVLAAAAYFERALSGAAEALGPAPLELRDVVLSGLLEAEREAQLVIEDAPGDARFGVYSRA